MSNQPRRFVSPTVGQQLGLYSVEKLARNDDDDGDGDDADSYEGDVDCCGCWQEMAAA